MKESDDDKITESKSTISNVFSEEFGNSKSSKSKYRKKDLRSRKHDPRLRTKTRSKQKNKRKDTRSDEFKR